MQQWESFPSQHSIGTPPTPAEMQQVYVPAQYVQSAHQNMVLNTGTGMSQSEPAMAQFDGTFQVPQVVTTYQPPQAPSELGSQRSRSSHRNSASESGNEVADPGAEFRAVSEVPPNQNDTENDRPTLSTDQSGSESGDQDSDDSDSGEPDQGEEMSVDGPPTAPPETPEMEGAAADEPVHAVDPEPDAPAPETSEPRKAARRYKLHLANNQDGPRDAMIEELNGDIREPMHRSDSRMGFNLLIDTVIRPMDKISTAESREKTR